MGLTDDELLYLEKHLKRKANEVELSMVTAEWSEHCSYKSSRAYLKLLPTKGKYVVEGDYDTTLLDVGNGYLITIHIESHNHPSAVEPYGGAATGVGGVVRDILSIGARPIALLDALRFGRLDANKWLFKNVVRGIADYGNCIGIPTIAGEVEFDDSFEGYCLVDVSCIGIVKKEDLIMNKVDDGDYIILAGGSTGRDGIHGAAFASKALEEEDRSAVQIPDPFMEKLLIDATLEAVDKRCIKAMKDLGGGGLACALSETADKFGVGMKITLDQVYLREEMLPEEIIISESQERMLYIIDKDDLDEFRAILEKYKIPFAIIGRIDSSKQLRISYNDEIVADISATLVANAPLVNRDTKKPGRMYAQKPREPDDNELKDMILKLLADASIASKRWIYQQYDHEVGLRTVIKPGLRDASILRLYNDKFLAVKLDGNSKHCYLDPYNGTKGCFAEACRNIVSLGAEPIGMVDHLQFGNPENPKTYHAFIEAIKGLRDYCNAMSIPCVGGKVSFYNESKNGEIKPSPVIGVIGLLDTIPNNRVEEGDKIIVTGITRDELGGSEYYEYIHNIVGGRVPKPDQKLDKELYANIRNMIREGVANYVHDCSKGGFAIALSEICIANDIGATVDPKLLLNECDRLDDLLFSESHSRFIIAINGDSLNRLKIPYSIVGVFGGDKITFDKISIDLEEAKYAYDSIARVMEHN